jgi:DNA repair protein RadC
MNKYSKYQKKAIRAALSAIEQHLTDNSTMTSTQDVELYLKVQLGGEPEECFGVMFLTSQHQFISLNSKLSYR